MLTQAVKPITERLVEGGSILFLSVQRSKGPAHCPGFDLEKLKDPSVLETFQAMTGGKLAPLTIMNNEDADMESTITTFNTAVTETASEILGKQRQKKKH